MMKINGYNYINMLGKDMEYNSDNIIYENNDSKIAFEYLYKYDDEYSVFMLYVENANFKGQHKFFLYIKDIISAYEELKSVYSSLCGNVIIPDMESESELMLSANGYDDISISGKIGGYYDCIKLEFDFKVDQTVISLLKNILKNAL